MPSRKDLKKNIHYISFELISECLIYRQFNPDVPDEKVDAIIEEIIRHRDEYLSRTNKPDGKDNPALVKKHYRAIVDDIKNKTIPLLDQLQEK
ncbi:MAG: hypothetical protein ACFCUM_18705 [Bacteroidales bacterium]